MGNFNRELSEERRREIRNKMENEVHIDDSLEMAFRARVEAVIDILKDKGLVDEEDIQKRSEVVISDMLKEFNQ
ncbi:hypothetical protein [Oceanobacillus jeddahense]|uniref:hypothetical protein n=1 Tax=Oceanobacillus jeddahense TaxID=1462527 RepID=UPI0005961C7B|nr:hypothetical protein [Oceanobacillus jeddahense]